MVKYNILPNSRGTFASENVHPCHFALPLSRITENKFFSIEGSISCGKNCRELSNASDVTGNAWLQCGNQVRKSGCTAR